MTTSLKIDGMTCKNCARHVREALEKVPGVQEVSVDLDASRATVTSAANLDAQPLIAAVVAAGYEAVPA